MGTRARRTTELRRCQRAPLTADLTIIELPGGQPATGRSIDLSHGGIGFYAPRFYPAGTRLRMLMWLVAAGRPQGVSLRATVRWARADEHGSIMGAEFELALHPADQPLLCELLDGR